jgi:hypothetical protein
MIEGRPFLYQKASGTLYHVGEKGVDVARPSSWSSNELMVALVDGDADLAPNHMLIDDTDQPVAQIHSKVSMYLTTADPSCQCCPRPDVASTGLRSNAH